MLFIGRTMNEETQLGRKEKGREGEKKGQSAELRVLLVESHGQQRCSVNVRVWLLPIPSCGERSPPPLPPPPPQPGCLRRCRSEPVSRCGSARLQHVELPFFFFFTRWLD